MRISKILFNLQEIDNRINFVKNSLQELDENIKGKFLEEKRKGIEEKKKNLATLQKNLNIKNLELKENTDKQEKSKRNISRISNPKELKKIESELGHLKKLQDKIEEDILVLMEKIDTQQKDLKKEEENFLEEEKNHKGKEKEYSEKVESLNTELKNLLIERESIKNSLPAEIYNLYENLLKNKDNLAVSKIEKGVCLGCSLSLSSELISEAKNEEKISFCENCERILYMEI